MEKKYEILTNDVKEFDDGTFVYRIKALKNFASVKAGELGGYVASERSLSHKGKCWVADNAIVANHARVCGDATVEDEAVVCGFVTVRDRAEVLGHTKLDEHVIVQHDAVVDDYASLTDYANIYGNAYIHGYATIGNISYIGGNADIRDTNDVVSLVEVTDQHDNITYFRAMKNGGVEPYIEVTTSMCTEDFEPKSLRGFRERLTDQCLSDRERRLITTSIDFAKCVLTEEE